MIIQDFLNKKIILGICGSIAAYKSAYLVRELVRLGAEVQVVMTLAAQKFISPFTMQALSGKIVRSELFDVAAEHAMGHIELARWADYLIIAPASANCLAKLAHGLADDLLSTLYLATRAPVLVCPAMNCHMWANPVTLANYELLKSRGVIILEPEDGVQACGDIGLGRMSAPDSIIDAIRLYNVSNMLRGHKLLISAGATREAIDPVRYITNHSSGKMGYALAKAGLMAGAEVSLVSGCSALWPPHGAKTYKVETAAEMLDVVMAQLEPGMIFISCAAVADYRPKKRALQKINKQHALVLELSLNPDILSMVAQSAKALLVIGFAAQTHDLIKCARAKLLAKNLDMIIANEVGDGLGFDSDYNSVSILTKNGQIDLSNTHKIRLAGQIIAIIATSLQNCS